LDFFGVLKLLTLSPCVTDTISSWLTLGHPLGFSFSITSLRKSQARSFCLLFTPMGHCSFLSNTAKSL
jgi:hypothetical protein